MTHVVACDRCDGSGCVKCEYHGTLMIRETAPPMRTVFGAIIWYSFLGTAVALLILFCLKGCFR